VAEWKDYADKAGLKPGTPEYNLERAKFYQSYIELIKAQRQKIITAQAKKRAIWLAVFKDDQAGQQLADVYERTITTVRKLPGPVASTRISISWPGSTMALIARAVSAKPASERVSE
jgi:hypothetical protein